jgi:ubiquinone/menaquinone biosynthesis C-methylase UbiE
VSAESAGRITLFTAPKPFSGHIGVIQRNALRSWAALGPQVDILVLGDEPGLAESAEQVGARPLQGVARNAYGTPLLSDIFRRAQEAAVTKRMAYLNADIILLDDFLPAVDRVAQVFRSYLIVGQRWDLALADELRFDDDGRQALLEMFQAQARRHPPAGSDYFVFARGQLGAVPDFALGRAGWDHWMIYAARHAGQPVVDASAAITIIHQDHDYAHLPGGQSHYRLPESRDNVRLGGGLETVFTLRDATWELTCEKLHKLGWARAGVRRWVEAGLISRVGGGRIAQGVRLGLHPLQTLGYFAGRLARPAAQDEVEGEQSAAREGRKDPHGRIASFGQEQRPMKFDYRETTQDLQTRIDIHKAYGSRDIDAWMLEVLQLKQGLRILDVGCGSGKQCVAFYQALNGKAEITGGDVSEELMAQAEERNAELGRPMHFIHLDFNQRFPVDDNAFDLVSCCFAIYYAEDIPFTIREMHRVLADGGRLFTTGPLPENKQLFYDIITEATGRPIPPMPGSSRYASLILDTIRQTFSAVEIHQFDNPLTFDSVQPFVDYTRASLSEDRRLWGSFFESSDDFDAVMTRIQQTAERRLAAEGTLTMTKVVGGFVATK